MQTDVLIVGAGPVGLALALDLGRRGAPCVVVDKGDGVVTHSKMGVVSVRTMEFCRRWGVSDAVRHAGFPDDYALNQVFCTSLAGHLLGVERYPSMQEQPETPDSPERKQRCPQLWFDPILQAAVKREASVRLMYGCELASFTQDASHVRAIVRDGESGETREITARYVVGCDGARSFVRETLGVGMQGEQLNYSVGIYFRSENLVARHSMGPAERYLFVGEDGNWGHLTVVDGRDYWRLTVIGSKERLHIDAASAQRWVRRCLGDDAIPFEIISVLPWRRSKLVADRYGRGRAFLCGDAVHVMSPNGGFGMNTGIEDAVDLGWKLDAVLKGWGGPRLLASYEAERRPIGLRNTNTAAGGFSKISKAARWSGVEREDEEGQQRRADLAPHLMEAARGNIEVVGVSLGYRYEDSPICALDGAPATPDEPDVYAPTARPGHRAPHAWISPGRSTLDLFGEGFTLLDFSGGAQTHRLEADAKAAGMPLRVAPIQDARIAALYEKPLVLVRPDGHVAWRGDAIPDDARALVDLVRGA
ncbi:MAG: dependent oxidoreductase family protein [Hyphomicrobiales bacterium]|nr:dependent oxidoreductase family protein [Hyphomicrobiales bacterium]